MKKHLTFLFRVVVVFLIANPLLQGSVYALSNCIDNPNPIIHPKIKMYTPKSVHKPSECTRAVEYSDIEIVAATGEGRTTGHIGTVSVRNRSDRPIEVNPGYVYIPSKGKYQDYVAKIPPGVVIPPGATIDIELEGYCADVRVPPVPEGAAMPPVEDWVPVGTTAPGTVNIFPGPMTPSFGTGSIPAVTADDNFHTYDNLPTTDYIPTWPGTNQPVGGTFDPDLNPTLFGPVLTKAVEEIIRVTTFVLSRDSIRTPYAANPDREREAVIQQTFWIFTSAVVGEPYTEDDFKDRVYDQFTSTTGVPVHGLKEEDKESLDNGVQDFWIAFQATGVEAKVIKVNDPPPPEKDGIPPPEKIDTADCVYDSDFSFNPELDYDHKIADSWGDQAERDSIIARSKRNVSSGVSPDLDEAYEEYDIANNPTSTVAFWRSNHVGGYASAYAKTWFEKADGSSEWVWNTQTLESKAEGAHNFWMEVIPEPGCKSIVIGTSISRIQATGKVFDAVAGNDENSLPTLRFYTWMGKKAVQFLIDRKAGLTKSSFKNYMKDAATSEVKDVFKEKLEEKAEEVMDQLLDELGIDLPNMDEALEKLNVPDIEEALEEILGIDIPSIEEGIDAAFDLFFWSNTYATAFGAMNITVGDNKGTVQALTRNMYLRHGLEDSEDAVIGMQDKCDELIVTDAKPGRLDIDVWGLSTMTSKADGNGYATAELFSMHFELLIGICICPNQAPMIVSAEVGGWYQPGRYSKLNQIVMANFRNDGVAHIESQIAAGTLTAQSEMGDWSKAIRDFTEEWSEKSGYLCKEK
jgi:hypothetical protein